MTAEFGLFALVLALLFSVMQVVIPTFGLWRNKLDWQRAVSSYVVLQVICVAISYVALTACFLKDDFTVSYVLMNSSTALPWFYKLCAVWGGHEGSLLLWVFILSLWTLAVACFSKPLDEAMRVRVLVVLGALSIGFLLFLLTASNPFVRQFQLLHSTGRDLNPLLQDPGFLFHPPMLYMGYVGFSVAFAFAIAALWYGQFEPAWAKWTRPWTLAAWCCLTAGITLGSWWAYRELGWGGWWFWDPVENASFMPWLVGTALIHSLAVSAQRTQFTAWSLLLAIMAFSLSLVGTFLVRSGVLTSVHAFAVDPQRGLTILLFLLVVIGGGLLLFATRAHVLKPQQTPHAVSREIALLLNNVLLVVIMLTVLMGTLYPLLIDALHLGKLSVGAPYFNMVFVPLMLPLLFLMGVGIHLKWDRDQLKRVWKGLRWVGISALLLPIILLTVLGQVIQGSVLLGLTLACWILMSTTNLIRLRIKQRGLLGTGRAFWGMCSAHMGIAVTVVGITVSSGYGLEEQLKLAPGDSTTLAGFSIQFASIAPLAGPNYHGTQGKFIITSAHRQVAVFPEKRLYDVGQMPMTDSAIDVTPFRDLYVAMGEPLGAGAWSVRLYYKPFVRWIWGGGFFIFLGGLLALVDRRYYHQAETPCMQGVCS